MRHSLADFLFINYEIESLFYNFLDVKYIKAIVKNNVII